MGALHRALFTWFMLLVFIILLVLRLDARIQWNWFIVFIPMWFYDTILLVYVFFNMMSSCRKGLDKLTTSAQRKLLYLFAILLKLTSLIILCLKLENIVPNISTVYIMIPIWVILPFTISDVFMMLIRSGRNRYL
ncbi:Transmembrane Fragile-X-F protein [Nesidiocoris tenuis]|uniref:Transmembrane Fragile-X-F protein n=1 Tax=Nesidiocoris tenuis TaxID=355587 RepID=A0ABN7BF28_9HEMI|nr:Transmembrane Fragile-X-F protein [Nesidiocoris tenuis]